VLYYERVNHFFDKFIIGFTPQSAGRGRGELVFALINAHFLLQLVDKVSLLEQHGVF